MQALVTQRRSPSKYTTTKLPLDDPSPIVSSSISVNGSAAIQSVLEILLAFPQLQVSGGPGTGSKTAAGGHTNPI
jgi:hypothetical protein